MDADAGPAGREIDQLAAPIHGRTRFRRQRAAVAVPGWQRQLRLERRFHSDRITLGAPFVGEAAFRFLEIQDAFEKEHVVSRCRLARPVKLADGGRVGGFRILPIAKQASGRLL